MVLFQKSPFTRIVKVLRDEKGLSQQALAAVLTSDQNQYLAGKEGKTNLPALSAAILSIPISVIARDEEPGTAPPLQSAYNIYQLLKWGHFEDGSKK